tara:strand:- start:6 stop:449 length:444 start_codon:yes stop_codon:yes gene_type:complete
MKNLLLKFKGWFGSVWNCVLNHYLCVCAVLITSICFMGYNLKITADYEKALSTLTNDHIEALDLIGDQSEALSLQGEALENQRSALNNQAALINKMMEIINEHRATILQQDQIIQKLIKILRDNELLPGEPNRSDANWILYEPKNSQ